MPAYNTATSYPKVSVFMMAYNHADYIAQALDGILAQQTNFSVEIVVGEDKSPDGTRAIIVDYVQRYPTRIKALLHETNIGAGLNQIEVLKACSGEYVAMCEGDDYWIDPHKLQKQVDFLDNNLEYSICFTRAYEELNSKRTIAAINPWEQVMTFTAVDLAAGNMMHTPSVIFRNGLIPAFPEWFSTAPVGDYVLHLLNAKKGLIKYLPDITTVYRRFVGGWSSKPMLYQFENFKKVIDCLLTEDFDQPVMTALLEQKNLYTSESLKLLLRDNNPAYLDKMRGHLQDLGIESEFVNNWMLHVYPERIELIQSAWSYRFYQYANASIARIRGFLGNGKRSIQRMFKK